MPIETRTALHCESLEDRSTPATASLAAGVLTVTGGAEDNRIRITPEGESLRVLDGTRELGSFASIDVSSIVVNTGAGRDTVIVGDYVPQPVTMNAGDGDDKLVAGGGGAALNGEDGNDTLFGGLNGNTFDGGSGADDLLRVEPTDSVAADPADRILAEQLPADELGTPQETLTAAEVETLLQRAAAASASSDAIIVITDRNGRILGVRVEGGVADSLKNDPAQLVFAIDGALAKARTGAFFGNNQAPLTSRTINSLSQSTITQREVESNPNDTDPNSTVRGPGFVAAVGINNHFPPGVRNAPQVDLFQIEHTNRDGTFHVGPDGIKGTADDVELMERFNIDPTFVPAGQSLYPPDSYGFESGLLPGAQSRGIATLPGGIPIFKNGQSVGGIGVFFPGTTGYATEENSSFSATYDPTKPDRTLEAEWIAFAAVGGASVSVGGLPTFPVGTIGGVALPPGFGLPSGRIDLVGITLDIFGPGGQEGLNVLRQVQQRVGVGSPNDGVNQVIDADANDDGTADDPVFLRAGVAVPEGWLVTPHDGDGITASQVTQIITQGIEQAGYTRAAIRLPIGSRAKMVFAVADRQGNIVGLYREPDATVFSIDVAVAKARNVAYYANAEKLQPIDQIAGVPAGTAFTNRTFRYLGLPRFPSSVDGTLPGPFSQINDGGVNPTNGLQVGPRLPASEYQSVVGYDSFNPGTNFHDPNNVLNRNGIVFFPGSAPLYAADTPEGQPILIGGLGVSGDGVDQDDVITIAAEGGFYVPENILRADQVLVRGVRLPYQKTNRNPEG